MSVTIDPRGHILKGTLCLKCGHREPTGNCDPKAGLALKLFLDDERRTPIGYSLTCKTVEEAISRLQAHTVWHCSLDHDLAEEHYEFGVRNDNRAYGDPPQAWPRETFKVRTGLAVLEWMRQNDAWVPDIQVHSFSSGANDMMTFLRKHAPDWVEFRRCKPKEI